jgi:DNA-directed RNA polymerase sigma subunit (sigma70/sigma32)
MKYNSFDKIFKKFLTKYEDLICEYENKLQEVLEDSEYDIYNLFENLLKINKSVDFEEVMFTSLVNAIQQNLIITDSFNSIISQVTLDGQTLNSTQRYFREVNDIYDKNDNNFDIEYCEENRNKLIEMNLKSVIAIAKKYQGLGLTLEELISAGNLGLCIAYDRYDVERSKLKDNMLSACEELNDNFTFDEAKKVMSEYLTYGDIANKFNNRFKKGDIYTKIEMISWIEKNVVNAKFNSIANLWIRAYILIEIDNFSRVVRKPKTEIYKDAIESGAYKKEQIINIDAPVGDDDQCTFGDMLQGEEEYGEIDISEAYDVYKAGLNKLLDGVKSRDRSVFLKKFGIGLPRPLLPREISQQEGLSIARISQILQNVIEKMQLNAAKYDVNIHELFEAARKLN